VVGRLFADARRCSFPRYGLTFPPWMLSGLVNCQFSNLAPPSLSPRVRSSPDRSKLEIGLPLFILCWMVSGRAHPFFPGINPIYIPPSTTSLPRKQVSKREIGGFARWCDSKASPHRQVSSLRAIVTQAPPLVAFERPKEASGRCFDKELDRLLWPLISLYSTCLLFFTIVFPRVPK